MRTSSLAFLVFLSTTVANAAVVREHHRANAQRANDIPGGSPPRDDQDTSASPVDTVADTPMYSHDNLGKCKDFLVSMLYAPINLS